MHDENQASGPASAPRVHEPAAAPQAGGTESTPAPASGGLEAAQAAGGEGPPSPGTPGSPETLEAFPAAAPGATLAHPHGLLLWLVLLVVLGVGGLFIGQTEMAALVAFAGIVMAAQAADLDRRWRLLYWLLGWTVPIGGCTLFTWIAWGLQQSDVTGTARVVLTGCSIGAALISLLTLARPFSNGLVHVMFRGAPPSYVLRLASRLVLMGLLFAVSGNFVFTNMVKMMTGDSAGILENVSMGGELVGYVVIALAAVGFLVRRSGRQTLERLGIRPLTWNHLGMVAAGLGTLVLLNSSAEWIQHRFLPDLWSHDRDINQRLIQGLGAGQVLMLGLSAGVGEEITVRGALQPRLGLVLTSVLFAALHVQYSWFGVLAILALALILGTIRDRTSTTVCILVHMLYDVLAVFTT